jgi:protocatechuate 3,4-dioxygenase alpha subunit
MALPVTPSQTVGPYLGIGLPWEDGPHAVDPGAAGAIRVGGLVLDGAGEPIADALVETWQASPPADDAFRGFARCPTDDEGRWEIVTLRPGRVPGPDGGEQAPHLDVSVFARGLLHRVVTRIYLPEDEPEHAADPVLRSVPADRRATLVAAPSKRGYHFDVRLQGPGETVFFDV